MAKALKLKKKRAHQMTADETMDRLFGPGAHKTIREILEREDANKGKRTPKPKAE